MPRDGSNIYSKPAGTTAIENTVIESGEYNQLMDDIANDLNAARPISSGGTGATTVAGALANLGLDNVGEHDIRALDRKFRIYSEEEAGNSIVDLYERIELKENLQSRGLLGAPAIVASGPSSHAEQQIANWKKNIDQIAGFSWTALADVPGARARIDSANPVHTQGTAMTGPVYSSNRTAGRALGQDLTIRNYISMARNATSALYTRDLAADGFPAGRAYAGAVCSNIFRNSFGHAYTPTTRMQATDPATWGFSSANEIFTIADIRVGDCLITWPSGGHIEGVYEKTGTTVTLFEMTHDGPTWTTYTNAEFMALVANKPYGLFRFDYENATIDYTPDPYSPITGEDVVAVEHDDVVTTEYGYGFNYASGDTVDIQIKSSDVTNYTIRRDGSVIETAATAGNTTISKTYTTAGDYSVTCTMTGGGESIETRFQVCKMEGSLSASSVASGSPVTFTFDAENCIPHTILIADQANRSISNGMIHEVTDAERLAGSATFTFPTVGSWMVRPRAEHQGGAVFPSNVNNFPLTIT